MKTILLSILILAGAMYAPASAGPVRNVEVEFPRGRTGTILNGRIEGYEEVRYAVKARAGQQLSVMLDTDNLSAYFNIFAPGHKPGRDRAMFVGSISGKRFEAVLAAGGEYILQVYQMRSAARRGETARYNLSVQVTGQPSPGAPPAATNAPTGNGID